MRMKIIIIAGLLLWNINPAMAKHHHKTHHHSHHSRSRHVHYAHTNASTDLSCLTEKTRHIVEQLKERFGRLAIVSTCRPGAIIAGTNHPSYHRWGMAVDFRPLEAAKMTVVNWLYDTAKVLVMTYSNESHIHFNIGQGQRKILAADAFGRHHYGSRHHIKRAYASAIRS